MAKNDKHIEFIKGFSIYKKGAKATLSRDLANMLIRKKVAKLATSTASKAKAKKSK